MKSVFIIVCFFAIVFNVFSQEDTIPVRDYQVNKIPSVINHNMDLGIGFGMDYGGLFGVQFGFVPIKYLTIFAAGGYYIIEIGWQFGIKTPFIAKNSENPFRPYLKAMYGSNSIIIVDGSSNYDKVYTGFTIGFGLEFRMGKKKQNGFDIDLNVPLRSPDFWEDWNEVKDDPYVGVTEDPLPFAISIGYHHEF